MKFQYWIGVEKNQVNEQTAQSKTKRHKQKENEYVVRNFGKHPEMEIAGSILKTFQPHKE